MWKAAPRKRNDSTTEIYNYLLSAKKEDRNEQRKVLIRIIVPDNEASRDNIILATNSQTTIPKAILRGTDSIHREIESYMKTKGLFYDRRKNFYKNEGKPKDKIISIPFLAQCLISILLKKPNYARARPSTLLNDEDTYTYLYSNNKILDSYYNAAIIGKKVKGTINSLGTFSISEQSDISFYVMYVCSAKVAGAVDITPEQLSLIALEGFTDDKVKQCSEYVFDKYKTLGGNNKVAKGTSLIDEILKEEFIKEPFNKI